MDSESEEDNPIISKIKQLPRTGLRTKLRYNVVPTLGTWVGT